MHLNRASSGWVKSMGILRIGFGLLWAIDAWYKWQPSFLNNLPNYLTRHLKGQLPIAQAWIKMWIALVNINPHAFGYFIAFSETALALALILGLFNNLTFICGFILSLLIWSTAEGFGGPYHAGATDIGTSLAYAFVFACLFLAANSRYYSVDRYLVTKRGPLSFLSSMPGATSVNTSTPDEDTEQVYTRV